jgi:hypothetical protein
LKELEIFPFVMFELVKLSPTLTQKYKDAAPDDVMFQHASKQLTANQVMGIGLN